MLFLWSVSVTRTKPHILTSAPGGVFSEDLSNLARLRQSAAAKGQIRVLGFFVKLITNLPVEISAACY